MFLVKDVKKRQRSNTSNVRNLKTQLNRHAADIQADKDEVQKRSGEQVPDLSVLRQTRKTNYSIARLAPSSMQGRSVTRTPGGLKQKGS